MIRLSLCMIVKNEEAVLTRVLASAIQFADETSSPTPVPPIEL